MEVEGKRKNTRETREEKYKVGLKMFIGERKNKISGFINHAKFKL